MAVEFKDSNDPPITPSASASASELQDYQTASADPESTNISYPTELTVAVPVKKPEHQGVIIAVLSLRIAEMGITIINLLAIRESEFTNFTHGIIYSLVLSFGFTVTGILLAIYAYGGFKKPPIKVLSFESVFCPAWAVVLIVATSSLLINIDHLPKYYINLIFYGFATALLYLIETCMNAIRKAIRNEEKVERDFIKFCKNYRGWNQPASSAYNGTDVSNDPNDHWTRKYDLNAISDGCIIIL